MPGVACTCPGQRCPTVNGVSDHPHIDPKSPKLMYLQVADHLTARITSGDLAGGARLPAERDMAAQFGVAYDTIRRATAVLRARGLIVTVVGRGTFVIPEDERPRD